jgi:hypothetical protein
MMGRMKVQLETAAIFSAVIGRQKKSVKVRIGQKTSWCYDQDSNPGPAEHETSSE